MTTMNDSLTGQKRITSFFRSKSSHTCGDLSPKINTTPFKLRRSDENRSAKKLRNTPKQLNNDPKQMILDAGQKRFGPVVCPLCRMIYSPDLRSDVEAHRVYHNDHVNGGQLSLCQLDRSYMKCIEDNCVHVSGSMLVVKKIVGLEIYVFYCKGRSDQKATSTNSICRVTKHCNNKLKERTERIVHSIVNQYLGTVTNSSQLWTNQRQIYIFLETSPSVLIVGCAIVDAINEASLERRHVDQDQYPNGSQPQIVEAHLGVDRIWVHPQHRRKNIATKLLDAARANLHAPFLISVNKVAFTEPTEAGHKFAVKYCNGQLLVYRFNG